MAPTHARRCGLDLQCRMPEGRADRCTQYRALFRWENTVLWEDDMLTDHSLWSTVLKNSCRYAAVAAVASLIGALVCATGVAFAAGFVETDLVANQQTWIDANGIVHQAEVVDP